MSAFKKPVVDDSRISQVILLGPLLRLFRRKTMDEPSA